MWRDLLGMYLTYMHGTGRPLGMLLSTVCVAWEMFWNDEDFEV